MKQIYDRANYYSQTNNPVEEYNLRFLRELSKKYGFDLKPAEYLESCGPSAAVMCCAIAGHRVRMEKACKVGSYLLQPEQVLWDFFCDIKANGTTFMKIEKFDLSAVPPNRFAKLYPMAVAAVFGVRAEFLTGRPSIDVLEEITLTGGAVQVSEEPGHFIAIGDVDREKELIIYNDPWDGHNGISGFCRRMTFDRYATEVKPYAVRYYPE